MSRAPTKICAHCSRMFRRDLRNTWAYWERAKYCGQECAGLAKSLRAGRDRPSMRDAFAQWVRKTDGCWEWTGARDKDGYGIFGYERKSYRAAKISLQLDGRPCGAGQLACHHCDNPSCVRPDHLYPGTQIQNMADAKRRNRLNPGRKAKITPDDVRAIRVATGSHSQIAAKFGIAPSNVTLIRNRKTWAHVI